MNATLPVRVVSSAVAIVTFLAAAATNATDLFVKPAGSGTVCTQSAPCTLPTALATSIAGDTIYLGTGSYTGTGNEVVLLDRSVNLLGGWDGAASGPIKRDHVVFTSTLNGQNARRVITILGEGTTPTVDGLFITGGNATGLTAGCGFHGSNTGCGGGILVHDASPTISDCNITGNAAVTAAADPDQQAAGGAISVVHADRTVIRNNTISNNKASTAGQGFGGGIAVEQTDGCLVEGNRIIGNTGTSIVQVGQGGGIAFDGGTVGAISIVGNLVRDNAATASGSYASGNALFSWYGVISVERNLFAASTGPGSEAVNLLYSPGSFIANRVEATGLCGRALTLFASGGQGGLVLNNVLVGGSEATVLAAGTETHPLTANLRHNTIVGNGAATGVLVEDLATVTLVNDIVAGHATGLKVSGSGSLVADHTLFWNNDDDGLRGTDPVDGDPRFVNRAFGDFHIFDGSAAQGRGVDAGIARDIDGDARPGLGAFDIGADQVAPAWFDFGTPSSPVAHWYTQVTPATVYSPARGFGWLSGSIAARDRITASELLRDFCFSPLGTFVVDVPNGRYRVTATTGDSTTAHSLMGFFLEGQQVASVSTQAGEYKTLTYDVSVTDGQLTLQLDDLGGSDPNVVINALIVLRMPGIFLDLGTASSPVAPGYVRVTPESLFSPEAGSGWLGGTVQARDRGVGSALLRDFNFTHMGYFSLFLEDNVYDLSLTFGDATGAHDNMSVALQAQGAGSLSTTAGQFVTRTYPACVVNNRLRIYLVDSGGKDVNVTLAAVQIMPRAQPRFDFGTATSPIAQGYQQVTPATTYASWRGYGWTAGTLSSRDRATTDPLGSDFVFGTQAEFAVDMLDGVYDVIITMGDATSAHDAMAVTLEGNLVDTVSSAAGGAMGRTYRVRVTGGQLNLALADQGGRDANVVINGLEIR
jgi:fibronectin type 3 domain-containing protein